MNKNPFKEIETNKEVPKSIKKQVVKSVDSTKLLMELGDLFFIKYLSVIEDVFKSKD